MKKLNTALVILIVILLIFVLANIVLKQETSPSVVIDNIKFSADIAKTPNEQTRGLAIYNKLPSQRGMVFSFEKADYYAFWMKDMKFPIDIIYIRDRKIVDIFKNVPKPESSSAPLPIYKPRELADTVFEINAGLSDKYGFKIGDVVKINY